MNQDKLYQDFPIAIRCESTDTVVFVAVPVGARYGDVRKTLGALINRPYASVNIGPFPEANSPRGWKKSPAGTVVMPFNPDQDVVDYNQEMLRAQILVRNEAGEWVAE